MAEVKNITEAKTDTKENVVDVIENADLLIRLSKEYEFEGEKISEIDFSGLEEVNAKAMMRANKTLFRTNGGDVGLVPELSLSYALIIAEECTQYPIAFYERLNPRDAMKVRTTIVGFMFGEE